MNILKRANQEIRQYKKSNCAGLEDMWSLMQHQHLKVIIALMMSLFWTVRLGIQDPKRLFKRYLITNSKYIWNIVMRGK